MRTVILYSTVALMLAAVGGVASTTSAYYHGGLQRIAIPPVADNTTTTTFATITSNATATAPFNAAAPTNATATSNATAPVAVAVETPAAGSKMPISVSVSTMRQLNDTLASMRTLLSARVGQLVLHDTHNAFLDKLDGALLTQLPDSTRTLLPAFAERIGNLTVEQRRILAVTAAVQLDNPLMILFIRLRDTMANMFAGLPVVLSEVVRRSASDGRDVMDTSKLLLDTIRENANLAIQSVTRRTGDVITTQVVDAVVITLGNQLSILSPVQLRPALNSVVPRMQMLTTKLVTDTINTLLVSLQSVSNIVTGGSAISDAWGQAVRQAVASTIPSAVKKHV